MTDAVFAPLLSKLSCHFSMSKSRLMTLCVLICGMAQARTVNLSHIAGHFPGAALHASNYRRLQRFFQHEQLDQQVIAQLVGALFESGRRRHLALDRSNWKLGAKDINVLVLALVTRRVRVPLMWVQLSRKGNSDTAQRIALMQRYLALFGASSIDLLLADREFVGAQWLDFLCKNNIPFAIRLKEGMLVQADKHAAPCSFTSLLRKRGGGTWTGRLQGMNSTLTFKGRRLGQGEAIIIATNTKDAGRAMRAYRKRWGIECLFGDCKSRGFNMEDTHMTAPGKLDTLLGLIAMAMAWAYRCATALKGRADIPRKAHGRREKSWFRTGLDALRRWLLYEPNRASAAWMQISPKRQRSH